MALDRTWYNTLVNDDGSGLNGSVWDKEDVNQLMNAIDAQLASSLVAGFPWVDYTPTLNSPQGVIFTAGAAYGRYQQGGASGKTVVLQYSIESLNFSFAASEFWISLPFAAAPWAGTQMGTVPIYISAYESGYWTITSSDSYVHIGRMGGQNIPATGPIYFRGTLVYRAQ